MSKKNKTVFDESDDFIIKNFNSNFYFSRLDWTTRSWLRTITKIVENRLSKIEKDIKEIKNEIEEKTLF